MRKTKGSAKSRELAQHKAYERYDYFIGIDSGTNTGFAVWSVESQSFLALSDLMIHQALFQVMTMKSKGWKIHVTIEDARKAVHGHNQIAEPHKLKLSGSVKRDATIWQDFCEDLKIPYTMVRPDKTKTKWSQQQFNYTTGYRGECTEHARDAGTLVWGKNHS